ncbi:hypothetical protein SELMODRAFT_438129 [Selaginella moellendorffii]|uniref:non-specific serine/threonine protein kinase n=2 Tax=Selaginella moellendorffii TaxID=88036 RepID=D8QUB2_SELML|nr:hypothetical protein SELMODRAFT_438129 [Selaginella moellendorffii]
MDAGGRVRSVVIGVDLVPIRPVRALQGDITTPKCASDIGKILDQNGLRMVDVVLHDGSPNVGGAWAKEAMTQSSLVLDSLKLATKFLAPKGTFVTKVFRSQDYNALKYAFEQLFAKVEVASRSTSAEIYVVGLKYLAPVKIDPRNLDPRFLFEEIPQPPKVGFVIVNKVLALKPSKLCRYDDANTTFRKDCTAADFVWSEKPLELLGSITSISFDDPKSSPIKDHAETSDEVVCDAVLPGMKLVASISKENKEPEYFSLEYVEDLLERSGDLFDEEEEEISFLFLVNSSLEIHGTKGVMWSTPTIGGVTDQAGYQFLKIYSNGEPRFTSRSFSTGNSTKSINLNPLFFGKSSLTRTCGISFETAEGCLCIVHEVRFFRGQGGMQAPVRTCENSQHYYMLEAKGRYFYKPLDLSSALHNVTPAACMALCTKLEIFRSSQHQATHKVAKYQKQAKPAIVAVFSVATMAIIIIAMVIWKKQINSYLKHYKPSLMRVFNYPELLTATKAFSEKIASGGVGTVFEGILSVAVKRLESFSSQGYKQFKAEESHYFLIYEYVANGSLDKWIYKPREELNWDTRFKIVEEIARGMCYLHEECSTRVLHLDIKPQNLLLDENFGVKIAEFGLSRMVEQGDLSDVMTMI